ncbi:dihydroxyacetone kinase, phosphotransfer subunit [Thermomonospora echinospora]|uniref:phosphoenolpyruvate--glycerone phosphotransferase n=1 Tax=Thermomonospora echinospora TaxID=1992 RepID=A0A1H5ZF69_9ACTN|nr:dihydroxyacetone kinase phosphoryl donor subunit DhaM [Thermomonospora echinospora]SEG34730.1 dihydroxyacetone kinase, phosphotransfer subunit [Thermomonospora echinospora]
MANVGLVVVSHSRRLAEGVCELAREMGVHKVRVEAAGGDVDGGLGTSIELVENAVRAADDGAGVVLLADLGSSVLTARTFVEDADTSVLLADAPLVEGAVAAASAAAAGADLAAVVAAAEDAYDQRKT